MFTLTLSSDTHTRVHTHTPLKGPVTTICLPTPCLCVIVMCRLLFGRSVSRVAVCPLLLSAGPAMGEPGAGVVVDDAVLQPLVASAPKVSAAAVATSPVVVALAAAGIAGAIVLAWAAFKRWSK